jgi:putative ABC transport system permease protein
MSDQLGRLGATFGLALASAWSRRSTLGLIALAMALATGTVLSLQRMSERSQEHFSQAIAGTDLIIGSKGNETQLVLSSVFHLGRPPDPLPWASAQRIAQLPGVAWAIPLTIGDAHRGFVVIGTDDRWLTHFKYGENQSLNLAQGQWFGPLFEVVLGAQVAAQLGYALGQSVVLEHEAAEAAHHAAHGDKPFKVTGILRATGTPVDRSLFVSLGSLQAIHLGWQSGLPGLSAAIPANLVQKFDLSPKVISALLVGLSNRASTLEAKRFLTTNSGEPVTVALPGVEIEALWKDLKWVQAGLVFAGALVGAASLLGLIAVFLAGMQERRRELAVLRAVGLSAPGVSLMLLFEACLVSLSGVLIGWSAVQIGAYFGNDYLLRTLGFGLQGWWPSARQWIWIGLVISLSLVAALLPVWRVYRQTLADGLAPQ